MSIDAIQCPQCGSENVNDFPCPHDAVYYGHYHLRCRACQHNWQAPEKANEISGMTYEDSGVRSWMVRASKLQAALLDSKDTAITERDAALARVTELEGFLRGRVALAPFEMQGIMRQHGYKLDNLKDPMQKLAFTFYTELVGLSQEAEQLLPEDTIAALKQRQQQVAWPERSDK